MDYIEAKRFTLLHICSVCGNEPVIYLKDEGKIEVRCQNKEHQGFTKLKGYRQVLREGGVIPIHIANKLQKREEIKSKDGN